MSDAEDGLVMSFTGEAVGERPPEPDLGDDPDGDVAGYDGGFTPAAASGAVDAALREVEQWNAERGGQAPVQDADAVAAYSEITGYDVAVPPQGPDSPGAGVRVVSPQEYIELTPQRRAVVEGTFNPLAEVQGPRAGLVDARRTLEKAEIVLQHADEYFGAKDHMNAAAHLSSDRVLPSPLAAEVASVLGAIARFKAAYPE